MSISKIPPQAPQPPAAQLPPAARPEAENDHDGDDGAAVTSAPPPGQGVNLDTRA